MSLSVLLMSFSERSLLLSSCLAFQYLSVYEQVGEPPRFSRRMVEVVHHTGTPGRSTWTPIGLTSIRSSDVCRMWMKPRVTWIEASSFLVEPRLVFSECRSRPRHRDHAPAIPKEGVFFFFFGLALSDHGQAWRTSIKKHQLDMH